jgi:hypothetical protein
VQVHPSPPTCELAGTYTSRVPDGPEHRISALLETINDIPVTTQFVDGFASEFRPMLVDMVLACAPMSYRPVYSIASKLYDST